MTTPPNPPPDLEEHETELWGQNVCDDYWRQAKMRAYGAACAAAERERIAAWLDAEHEKRKHLDNHAAFYAAAIRAQETP